MSFLALLFFLALSHIVSAQVPPPPPPPPPSGETSLSETVEESGPQSLKDRFVDLQNRGAQYINSLFRELRLGFKWSVFFTVIFFSLLYGVFHTLGPGHGKLIVLSYFTEKNRTMQDAAVLSLIISLIHGSGAVILAVLFRSLLSGFRGAQRIAFQYGFTVFSGALLVFLGTYYLIRRARKGRSHDLKEISLSEEAEKKGLLRRNLIAGFSIGIVPCPFSLAIMSISIVSGVFWIGLSSVFALTISMTLVLYVIACSTIKTRDAAIKSATRRSVGKSEGFLSRFFSYGGMFSMILLGFFICYRGVIAMAVWRG